MQALKYIVEQIHTVVVATTDEVGDPVTCAIDIMDCDTNGLYFLTAKGKNFYNRLKKQGRLAFTGIKCESTMSCICKSVCPQNCIGLIEKRAVIEQKNCLHCGNCFTNCPYGGS